MVFGLVKMHCTVVGTMEIIHVSKMVDLTFHLREKKNE